jgi:hypothetical protein
MGLGAGFLSVLDALLAGLRRAQGVESWRQDALLMTAITLHNIPEGMAVGLAFALAATGEGFAAASALALGIGIQNSPRGRLWPCRCVRRGTAACGPLRAERFPARWSRCSDPGRAGVGRATR